MPGSDLLILNAGFIWATPEDNDKKLNGNTFTLGYESSDLDGDLAGVNYFISDKILINGNYNLSWLANGYYKDGMVQNFTIGLGYQFF